MTESGKSCAHVGLKSNIAIALRGVNLYDDDVGEADGKEIVVLVSLTELTSITI
jgi:hypothetical protein